MIVLDELEIPGIRHAFFTRRGGVSGGLYSSLNCGLGSDDKPQDVISNRTRAMAALDLPLEGLITCHQIHSAEAVTVHEVWAPVDVPKADAMVTSVPGIALGVLTADCAPILLADPETRIVAAVHAGWKGALGGVVHSAVAAMQALGADPRHIRAVVGPCIAPASYEVGLDFQDRFAHHDPGSERFFHPGETDDKRRFDLPGFVLWRLQQAGVGQAVWTGHDTCADAARFYSNRRAFQQGEPDFGRLISVIGV